MCVTVICCYNTIQYSVTVMCVCYCNVLLQYSTVKRYCYMCVLLKCVATVQYSTGLLLCSYIHSFIHLCVCVTVICCYNTIQYSVTVMCVTVMCCYNTIQYSVTCMCVCYCNVLLQYNTVQRYCNVCVLL